MTFSNDWSRYWKHGSLTTFIGGEYHTGYSGETADFWQACFERQPERATLVDLATGNGAVPLIAARISQREDKRFRIIGIDYADIRLPTDASIRKQMDAVELIANTPMENTGLEPASVDFISSQFGFEYGNQQQVLDEIDRVLGPSGQLALVLHHPDSAVVAQARREYQQTQLCINEERLDRKVRDLVRVIGDARTPEQRSQLKFNREAEKYREQINRTMARILQRVKGENDTQVHQVAQSFLRVFADLSGQSKQQKLDFIENASSEFLAYAGRMQAMSAATLDQAQVDKLIQKLEQRAFRLEQDQELHSASGELVARAIKAKRAE